MARLLPSRTDQPIERERDPSVLYVDSDRAENVISTLSGDTAMKTFRMLNDEALTASEVADRLDLSVQNASYHLENLQDADLVEVVDTCYSEKGREMAIYAVTSEPKVLVLGTEQDQGTLRRAFGAMAGAIGAPALVIAAWSALAGGLEPLLQR
ncbi:ArsR family transcriptional regulator [Halobacteriales archaeon QH_2_65_14]|nr:MAG: ArsR family transcriptional regulator [Halobacteriales archaeon QH_2_65_14]